jgi:hypothetical protein
MSRPRHQSPNAPQVDQVGAMRAQESVRRQEALQPVERHPQDVRTVVSVEEAGAVTRFDELDSLGCERHMVIGGWDKDPGDGRGYCLKTLQTRPDAANGLLDARGR